ncbi:MAG: family 10 glycosylhydrolase [Verrucomicrobiota bacterium]|jgi:uncharacterized lipoprotein YddW (UPF0748 family)|nr:family 10 glycosylhydrolase [Verrucomicrobiota bacterium]
MRFVAVLFFTAAGLSAAMQFVPTDKIQPPVPTREFRGAWIATVNNIDWPSKPGLSTADQKKELHELINHAATLKLNCVIFQVRPACDALYLSAHEPWSEYLTGKMGKAPKPFYDPLTFALDEAHKRGLELHAWFNPYRARYKGAKGDASTNHVSRTKQAIVKSYNGFRWLDPAEPEARAQSFKVILDVLRRYDVDGIHIDDYFYPYPDAKQTAFPDDTSWKRYRGKLSRKDWRRMHINNFIRDLHTEIHKVKPWVKFGVSPFGIWRPGHPKQIKGLDAYDTLYADARLWLREGWLDYCAPQLYWQTSAKAQSYPVLMQWWHEQNPKRRHLWPGNNTARINPWPAKEIISQINLTRQHPGVTGNIHWNLSALHDNRKEIATELQSGAYAQHALPPASPWLDNRPPNAPVIATQWDASKRQINVSWRETQKDNIRRWIFQMRVNGKWHASIVRSTQRIISIRVAKTFPDAIAITAIDAGGNTSKPAVLAPR